MEKPQILQQKFFMFTLAGVRQQGLHGLTTSYPGVFTMESFDQTFCS